jgi:hypothetical protein
VRDGELGEEGRPGSRLLLLGWIKTSKRLLFGRPIGIHGSDLKPEPTPEFRRVGFGRTHGCKTAPKPTPSGLKPDGRPNPWTRLPSLSLRNSLALNLLPLHIVSNHPVLKPEPNHLDPTE